MTRPRTTTSPTDALGATLSDSKSRLVNLEALAHRHETVPLAPLNSPTFTGTVTIPAGASIVGYAPLASPSFTGSPTYAGLANPYGWHTAGQPLGTEMVIGAYGRQGGSFSAANAWIDIGSVGVTVPVACQVMEIVFGFSIYTSGSGQYLVRVLYSGTGQTGQLTYFSNEGYSHKIIGGTIGVGCAPGTGTVYLQVFGNGISLINDANDSAYFTVHTI